MIENNLRTAPFTSVVIACLICVITVNPAGLIPAAFAGSAVTAAANSTPIPGVAHSAEHINGDLSGLSNMGRVSPGIYRGAQPEAKGYATLKKMGIRTVINLRTTMSEKKAVEAAGMRSIEVPITMSGNGLKDKVDRVVSIMADPANRPVFVHCRQGRDRTGIVVAAYRMKMEGWSLAEAEAEMNSFGFNDIWVHFRRFIRKYAEQPTMH